MVSGVLCMVPEHHTSSGDCPSEKKNGLDEADYCQEQMPSEPFNISCAFFCLPTQKPSNPFLYSFQKDVKENSSSGHTANLFLVEYHCCVKT